MGQAKFRNAKINNTLEQFAIIGEATLSNKEDQKTQEIVHNTFSKLEEGFLNEFVMATQNAQSWVNTVLKLSSHHENSHVVEGFRTLMNNCLEQGAFAPSDDKRYSVFGLPCLVEHSSSDIMGSIHSSQDLQFYIAEKLNIPLTDIRVVYSPLYGDCEINPWTIVRPVFEANHYFGLTDTTPIYGAKMTNDTALTSSIFPFFVLIKSGSLNSDIYSLSFDENLTFSGNYTYHDNSTSTVKIKPLEILDPFTVLENSDYYYSYHKIDQELTSYCEEHKVNPNDVKANLFVFPDEDDEDGNTEPDINLSLTFSNINEAPTDFEDSSYIYSGKNTPVAINYITKYLKNKDVSNVVLNVAADMVQKSYG